MAKKNKAAVSAETTGAEQVKREPVKMATEREAKELARSIRVITDNQVDQRWWDIGSALVRAIEGQAHVSAGYKNFKDWWKNETGLKQATVYRVVREVKYLRDVERRDLLAGIKEGNANLLCKLKPEDGRSEEWLKMASSMSLREFGSKVSEKRVEYGFPKPEKWERLPTLPESAYTIYQGARIKLAEAMDIDLESKPELEFKLLENLFAVIVASSEDTLREFLGEASIGEEAEGEAA